jgi:hypothetical protein
MIEKASGRRLHLREAHTTELVIKLSLAARRYLKQPASFVVWSPTAEPAAEDNLDPNYLYDQQMLLSPWHRAMADLASSSLQQSTCLFWVDVHGKLDRKKNLKMDVGLGALYAHWPCRFAVDELKCFLKEHLGNLLSRLPPIGKRKFGVEFPQKGERGCGFWGTDAGLPRTVAHQAARKFIPSIQLELPRTLREMLMADDGLLEAFTAVFCAAHHEKAQPMYLAIAGVPHSIPRPINIASDFTFAGTFALQHHHLYESSAGGSAVVDPTQMYEPLPAHLIWPLLMETQRKSAAVRTKQI